MAAREPLSLLRSSDPAAKLSPLSDERRLALLERAMTANPPSARVRPRRTLRARAPQFALALS